MIELVDFLLSAIAEDERRAEVAANLHADEPPERSWDTIVRGLEDAGWDPRAAGRLDQHVTTWDPARVLAECDAKRRIVAEYTETSATYDELATMEAVLRLMALPYAHLKGYREEWRP